MIDLKRILLVEENPNDVELTIEALGEHNLANAVDIVRDGEEALNYLYHRGPFASRPKGSPAFILLDLKLPKVNGIEVLKKIRSEEHLKFIPVVALTSSREERDLNDSYRFGVNAYVVKPVDFHEFMDALKGIGIFWAILNEPPPGNATS